MELPWTSKSDPSPNTRASGAGTLSDSRARGSGPRPRARGPIAARRSSPSRAASAGATIIVQELPEVLPVDDRQPLARDLLIGAVRLGHDTEARVEPHEVSAGSVASSVVNGDGRNVTAGRADAGSPGRDAGAGQGQRQGDDRHQGVVADRGKGPIGSFLG